MKIFNNITELIGGTPLVKINSINPGKANILAKLEYFNPSGSVKDRAASYMLTCASGNGSINKNTLIIEPTSGNTGIGLAMFCAAKGMKLVLTMPESASIERRKILKAYGAKLVLTPAKNGMQGALDKALDILEKTDNSFMPSQFTNPDNVKIHELTTAEEIYSDTDGSVDVIVAGIGSGGTITGISKKLKSYKPSVYSVGVEPAESPLLSQGKAGSHKIQGIGANFVPEIFDKKYVDEIFTVRGDDAMKTARECAEKEGILIGISAGAALKTAFELSKRQEFEGKNIVVIFPDSGERYLSTELFGD